MEERNTLRTSGESEAETKRPPIKKKNTWCKLAPGENRLAPGANLACGGNGLASDANSLLSRQTT